MIEFGISGLSVTAITGRCISGLHPLLKRQLPKSFLLLSRFSFLHPKSPFNITGNMIEQEMNAEGS